jgi:hypothetical protein
MTPPRCPVCGMKNGMILGRDEHVEILLPQPLPATENSK